MSQYKVAFFGSDLISLRVLSKMNAQKQRISSMKVIAPPYKKPKTPLAELHTYLKKGNIEIMHEFGTDT